MASESGCLLARSNPVERIEKGIKRPFDDFASSMELGETAKRGDTTRRQNTEQQPQVKKQKTGLKLKIKFNGAVLSGANNLHQPRMEKKALSDRPELDALCLPEAEWRMPAPAKWKEVRQMSRDEVIQIHAPSLASNSQMVPPPSGDREQPNEIESKTQLRDESRSKKDASVVSLQEDDNAHAKPNPSEEAPIQQDKSAGQMQAMDEERSIRTGTEHGDKADVCANMEREGKAAETQEISLDPKAENLDKVDSKLAQLIVQPSQHAAAPERILSSEPEKPKDVSPLKKRTGADVETADGKKQAKRRPESPSPSSSTSSETNSDSDSDSSSHSRRGKSRSREAGEMSDSEHLGENDMHPDHQRRRSRSPGRHAAEPYRRRERSRSRDGQWHYDRSRHFASEREREDYARHKRRMENFLRHEREKAEKERLRRKGSRVSERDERERMRRSSSVFSDEARARRHSRRSRSRHERHESRSQSRQVSPRREREAHLKCVGSNPTPAHRNLSPEVQPPLPPEEPTQAAVQTPFGFADAWNMLMGSAQEDWGTEADIDDLHNAATAAKHKIANLSKATNGNNTFENLIALMRESYLKYMQVAALWESIARMPNPPPNRNRARLADDGGMYPGTIALMHQIASECRTCPANTEASAILRILAERLMAIMQMRVAQVQKNKVHQDRQFLLSCSGAPKVDAFGRKLPGSDNLNETYQRPSPTDSNASNNTSEQALPHPLPKPGIKAPPPVAKGRAPLAPAQKKGNPLGVKAGKVTKGPENPSGKGNAAKRVKSATPQNSGREDAWAVHPVCWEIPPVKFESELRSWTILGGVINCTAQMRGHTSEIQKLMQLSSPCIREAAGMLGFVDLGLGMSNINVVLQLSHNILDLVLKIQLSGSNPPLPAS